MSCDRCHKFLKSELQWNKFKFLGVHEERFMYFQWRVHLCVVMIYRVILALYTILFLIYTVWRAEEVQVGGTSFSVFVFLSMWTYCVLALYLSVNCVWCIVCVCRQGRRIFGRMSAENHRQMFHELEVQPSLWGKKDSEQIPGRSPDNWVDTSPHNRYNSENQVETSLHTRCSSDDQVDTDAHTVGLHWLPKLIWCLYNIASSASFMVTIVFWVLLAFYPHLNISDTTNGNVFDVQLHGVNSAIVLIELCLSAVPVYLPHYVYTLLYVIIYLIFTGIYYAVDHSHILYPDYLDWNKPGRTAGSCVVVAVGVLPVVQIFMFLMYKLRLVIYDKCNPELI